MSAALTSTRTAVPRLFAASKVAGAATITTQAQSSTPERTRSRNPKLLINDVHRALYPHLYGSDGSPTVKIESANVRPKTASHIRRELVAGERARRPVQNKLQVYKPQAAIKKTCPDPVSAVTSSQIAILDPTGARTRLFAKDNPEGARVGDILLVRQRTGDPFAGVCINIRRRGTDTAILLRGQLTRVGVEMWYKIYSPLVEGIEVVQRAAKRARRARLTYMRTVKHDRGSVENVVRMYLRQKAALGTADGQKKKGVPSGGAKKGARRGKKR